MTLRILFDQNIPPEVAHYLQSIRPGWQVSHVSDWGLSRSADSEIFQRAQATGHIVITFDEDFADSRMFPVGTHAGVIRFRVWPTTVERTIQAVDQLLHGVPPEQWPGSLIIVDNQRIRIRRRARHG